MLLRYLKRSVADNKCLIRPETDRDGSLIACYLRKSSLSSTRTPHVDRPAPVNKSKWVINSSFGSLSNAEVSLQKGLNFAITPTSIPATEIVAKVKSAIRQLDAEQAETVRRNLNLILQKAEPPKPNITREMRQALRSSQQTKSVSEPTMISREKRNLEQKREKCISLCCHVHF